MWEVDVVKVAKVAAVAMVATDLLVDLPMKEGAVRLSDMLSKC